METAVSNTSPLIALSIIEWLDLPGQFFDPIVVPQAVVKEAIVNGAARPGAREIDAAIKAGWIRVESPRDTTLAAALSDELGLGEAEAITLAVEYHCVLIIDEPAGRHKAKRLGLRIIGTLGLLALAKNSGKIDLVSPWISKLQAGGYRLGDSLIARFLKDMGETRA